MIVVRHETRTQAHIRRGWCWSVILVRGPGERYRVGGYKTGEAARKTARKTARRLEQTA